VFSPELELKFYDYANTNPKATSLLIKVLNKPHVSIMKIIVAILPCIGSVKVNLKTELTRQKTLADIESERDMFNLHVELSRSVVSSIFYCRFGIRYWYFEIRRYRYRYQYF